MDFFSTTNFAKEFNVPVGQLFNDLQSWGWIERESDKWVLTPLGREKGGETRFNPKFGEYIVWPEDISFENKEDSKLRAQFLNATAIGKHFDISSQRLNLILAELGWIEKSLAGWELTKLGKTLGGRQYEHDVSGGLYVLWPESIIKNKNLTHIFLDTSVDVPEQEINLVDQPPPATKLNTENFRDKFPATLRTKDGHMVRSRAEVIIDNALYDYGLAHAYERKLPIEEDLYSDFFIPSDNVYIEYWGMENDQKYLNRKQIKLDIYKKYDFKLIELSDDDIANLDDHLPKKLLKFGIKVY